MYMSRRSRNIGAGTSVLTASLKKKGATQVTFKYRFGELVKAKLIERKMSQRGLALITGKSPSYITYIVTGVNKASRRKTFEPGRGAVESIAHTLGIPMDEAYAAAGLIGPPRDLNQPAAARDAPTSDTGIKDSVNDEDKALFDVAYAAALKAVRGRAKTSKRGSPQTRRIRIDLPGKMHLLLVNDGEELSDDEVERYRAAFVAAYEAVR